MKTYAILEKKDNGEFEQRRLFTVKTSWKGSVREIARQYWLKYPDEIYDELYIANRWKVKGEWYMGHPCEMDRPQKQED